jgi:hypothetical protein
VDAAQNADVVCIVDDGRDPQGPAVFEVGLDAEMPVEALRTEPSLSRSTAGRNTSLVTQRTCRLKYLYVVRAADVQVVGGEGSKDRACRGAVKGIVVATST